MLKNFIYYILNLSFINFDAELFSLLKNKKKITIFDIGCFKGVFFKKFYHSKKLINTKKKFYIFDINPNVSKYLENYTNKKDIIYNYIELGKSNKKKNTILINLLRPQDHQWLVYIKTTKAGQNQENCF